MTETWDEDLLGFKDTGATFTKLVQSVGIDEPGSKVISIEAGFGRGKTFFRENWAQELRDAGEVVVEIDARQSDHSGDPVVTFIGALVGALGKDEETRLAKAKKAGIKYGALLGRTVVKAAVGKAADELFETVNKGMEDAEANDLLRAAVDGFGDGMSKFAAETIAAQLKAEEVRTKEMPAQLDALREALAGKGGRVVVLIDELDRCHPDYAITLLEAMKLVFDRPGYVFVLMVNSDHLERIAAHRFIGWHKEEEGAAREPYLDKFVDMRLKLPAAEKSIGEAARALAMALPEPEVPFGEGPEFTIDRAAKVAADLAPLSELSLRQIKRVLLRVELAVRAYQGTPVDVPLLTFLAFQNATRVAIKNKVLRRSGLIVGVDETDVKDWGHLEELFPSTLHRWQDLRRTGRPYEELEHVDLEGKSGLPGDRYRLHFSSGKFRKLSVDDLVRSEVRDLLQIGMAPWYIPEHQAMLDHVHQFTTD